MEKIKDLTMLSDILPTGFHGAVSRGVGVVQSSTNRGCWAPSDSSAAASAQILGAAVVMIGNE